MVVGVFSDIVGHVEKVVKSDPKTLILKLSFVKFETWPVSILQNLTKILLHNQIFIFAK